MHEGTEMNRFKSKDRVFDLIEAEIEALDILRDELLLYRRDQEVRHDIEALGCARTLVDEEVARFAPRASV